MLFRTRYTHRLMGVDARCVRGKSASGVFSGYGTFQWTSGVQALSILAIETALDAYNDLQYATGATLCGEKGSLASSLDYAISRQPRWIQEMFGDAAIGLEDVRIEPRNRRLFSRTNPEGRWGGNMFVSFDPRSLPGECITIFVNDIQLKTPKDLFLLRSELRAQVSPSQADIAPSQLQQTPSGSEPSSE